MHARTFRPGPAPMSALPFVKMLADQTLDLWAVPAGITGSEAALLGAQYAADFIAYVKENGGFDLPVLVWITDAIHAKVRQRDLVAIHFMLCLQYALRAAPEPYALLRRT